MALTVQLDKDLLTCSICSDFYKKPKSLSCLHRFCETCLQDWINVSATNDETARGFLCPLCKEFIQVTDSSKSPSEWASHFKTDFYVNSLLQMVEDRAQNGLDDRAPMVEQSCPSHIDKACDFYCVDCSKVMCSFCAAVAHKRCSQVLTLDEAASNRKTLIESKLNEAVTYKDKISKLESSFESCVSQLQIRKEGVVKEIRQWGQRMHAFVTEEQNKVLNKFKREINALEVNAVSKVQGLIANQREDEMILEQMLSTVKVTRTNVDLMNDSSILESLKKWDDSEVSIIRGFEECTRTLSQLKLSVKIPTRPAISLIEVFCSASPYGKRHAGWGNAGFKEF